MSTDPLLVFTRIGQTQPYRFSPLSMFFWICFTPTKNKLCSHDWSAGMSRCKHLSGRLKLPEMSSAQASINGNPGQQVICNKHPSLVWHADDDDRLDVMGPWVNINYFQVTGKSSKWPDTQTQDIIKDRLSRSAAGTQSKQSRYGLSAANVWNHSKKSLF